MSKTAALLFMLLLPITIVANQSDDYGKQALNYTNQFRRSQGLSELIWHQDLADCAKNHSRAMGVHTIEFGHDGFRERIKNLSFFVRAAAENVFMTNQKGNLPSIAVHAWIASPGHLHNIVGNYTHCGIGVFKNAQGFWYFTQIFATFG